MKKKCSTCGKSFDPADRAAIHANVGNLNQIKYCSETCARKAENQRYYAKHQKEVIEKVHRYYRRKKKALQSKKVTKTRKSP